MKTNIWNWIKEHKYEIGGAALVIVVSGIAYYIGKKTGFDLGFTDGVKEGAKTVELPEMALETVDRSEDLNKVAEIAANEGINYYMLKALHEMGSTSIVDTEEDFSAIYNRILDSKGFKAMLD